METFIITVTAQPGHDDGVTRFYEEIEPLMSEADGFIGRKLYRARTGTMVEAVKKAYTAEELAAHPEPPHEDPGTQFIIIEEWESVDKRIAFGKANGDRNKDLIPHLLPSHTHEFYDEFAG
ncbi:MAG: hypothetical protein QF790_03115 [Gammaproteobacteria bacterium]|nr:hypothetical protein [Gammaproteobacteria bacterium]MDP6616139.1 hypothetical protein [Gammaproteobacteria bacterium]MDP6694843.1 hypothetical protein [Gammaproteobacteria bacterium]